MDERLEKARKRAEKSLGTGNKAAGYDAILQSLCDMIALYDDLAARREQDIREAVEVERNKIIQALHDIKDRKLRDGHKEYSVLEECRAIRQRGKATDPATIRREERERIAAAARDTQRWVGGNYPAWAHEMFRQFASAVERGDIPDHSESKEAGS